MIFWTKLDGFEDIVREVWIRDPVITDPFKHLDSLLRNTAHGLTAWGQKKVCNIWLQIAIANWEILQFDKAQEKRVLSLGERLL